MNKQKFGPKIQEKNSATNTEVVKLIKPLFKLGFLDMR